jgi:hypothetical protein
MIAIITNKEDVTSDLIVMELQKRGSEYLRLNMEDMEAHALAFDLTNQGPAWRFLYKGRQLSADVITACYFRRPGLPSIPESEFAAYQSGEWLSFRENFFCHLDGRWLNSPTYIAIAENKAFQIESAWSLGFSIPRTMIAASTRLLDEDSADGDLIVKPVRTALISIGGFPHVVFTSRATHLTPDQKRGASLAPFITQREIYKNSDVRVTVVGERVFATEIGSQEFEETRTDWRRGGNPELTHTIHTLPEEVADKCTKLVSALNLRFGAIDLIQDRDGQYWFLEINPNGQWGWIEHRTKVAISAAIVDELLSISLGWSNRNEISAKKTGKTTEH